MLRSIQRAALGRIERDEDGKIVAVQPPDWRAAAEFLDRTAPEYRKLSRTELTGKDGGPVAHQQAPTDPLVGLDLSRLSLEEQFVFDQLLARMLDPGESKMPG